MLIRMGTIAMRNSKFSGTYLWNVSVQQVSAIILRCFTHDMHANPRQAVHGCSR